MVVTPMSAAVCWCVVVVVVVGPHRGDYAVARGPFLQCQVVCVCPLCDAARLWTTSLRPHGALYIYKRERLKRNKREKRI